MSKTLKYVTIFSAVILSLIVLLSCQANTANSESDLNSVITPFTEKTPTTRNRIADSVITIAAGGDLMLGSPFPNASRMPPNDGKFLLKPVTPIVSSADIGFGNLEGPMIDGGISSKCGKGRSKCFAFKMPTRYGKYLKEAGFDILSVANNHAGDFGANGRASTRRTLDALGIKHAGSDKGKFSTAYLTVKGKRIAFIGFSTNAISLNINDLNESRRAVRQADRNADIVVVSFHGGAEGPSAKRVPRRTEIFFGEKRGNLRLFSKAVIDAGADLVLGHGPHVLRGMEMYKNRLIVYSLGNLVTYGWFRLAGETAETLVLEIRIDGEGKFIGGKIHPFVLKGRGILTPDKTMSAIYTIKRLSRLDFPTSAPRISVDGAIATK